MQNPLRGVIGVLGFGVDGKCVVEFLEKQPGVREVRVFDDAQHRPACPPKPEAKEGANLTSESKGDKEASGKFQWGKNLEGVDLLFRSPGFRLTHPLVLEAKRRKIPITSSTTYFLQHFPGVTVGITGSNGKTTCTALVAAMLRMQFGKERVEEGGNDRAPRLDLLCPSPNPSPDPYYAVLELSSFQLIDCPASPHVAVVLNVTPNHLDWHASMQEYIEAKRRIVSGKRQAVSGKPVVILNEKDPIVRMFADGLQDVSLHWFANCQLPIRLQHGPQPRRAANCRFRTHPDTIRAAVTAARALGVTEKNIVKVLEAFPGAPQRLEFVRELDQVKYYNDSSATTPESAITACEAFPAGTVVLLLGGRDKGMDFSKLYDVIEKRDVAVVPYGEMAETFERHIPKSYKLKAKSSFEEAIATARSVGRPNVVLSPACASFDMFANARERGEIFAKLVSAL